MENPLPADSREQKRAQFAEGEQPKSKTAPLIIIIAIVLVAIAVFVFMHNGNKPAAATITSTASNDIRIPLSDLGNQAKFFDYMVGDKKMRFFAVKSSDGVYRAALDACMACYRAKKGYHQEGDDMVCNNCGMHFPSTMVNESHGGCNPVALPREVQGDSLVIKPSEIESRQQYF